MRLTGLAAIVFVAVSVASAEDNEIVALVRQLDSSSLAEKTKAARQLGEIGPSATDAVASLIKLHDTPDPGLRYEVVIALGRINSKAKLVVPALDHLLGDSVGVIRLSAIEGLRGFGSRAQEAIPHLAKLLDDKEPSISVNAALAIVEIQVGKLTDGAKVKSVLISGLKCDDPEVSADAIHGLTILGSDAVPSISELLSGPNLNCRIQACNALAAIGPGCASAVNDLIAASKSSEVDLRWHAISALGEIGPAAKLAVPNLIAALEDENRNVELSAQNSLHKIGVASVPALIECLKKESLQRDVLPVIAAIGPDAADAVPALTALLAIKNLETKREVILALAGIGEAAKSTSGELIKALSDKQFPYRPAAAFALGKIKSKEAVPALKDALQDSADSTLQLASVWALLQFEPHNEEYINTALPKLTKALENEKPGIRKEAIRSLGQIGARAKSSVGALKKVLSDTDSDIRREALVALAEIGPESASAIPEITRVLTEDEPGLRQVAIYVLGRLGAASKPAVPQLHRSLFSHNTHEKTLAAWALVNISPDPAILKQAIPVIVKGLEHAENPEARSELARTLGKFGASFPEAKEALKGALKDPDENVRKSAEMALSELK